METSEAALGSVTEDEGGTITLRYERLYPRPIQSVWAAISDPVRIADWLGTAELEPHVGGRFSVMVGPRRDIPILGEVVAWDPPALLSCSWAWPGGAAGLIRFELSAEGSQATRLVFTHSGLPRDQMLSVLPGWHLYLERLGQVVEGGRPDPDFSTQHATLREVYGRHHSARIDACS